MVKYSFSVPRSPLPNLTARFAQNAITPAVNYMTTVIPAKAGIQKGTGYRIKSGMTELAF